MPEDRPHGSDDTEHDLDGLAAEWRSDLASRSTKERVYAVVTGLTDPTRVADIAERADCSVEGARSNLQWFVEIGIASRVADKPALYQRNDAYFDFLRIHRLVESYTLSEFRDEIAFYEQRDDELADGFAVSNPSEVDLYAPDFDDPFDDVYDRLSEWRTVRRRLGELRRAKLRLEETGSTDETSASV